MNTFIYALIDPETNTIRYIGKSDNPKKRLRLHLTEARTSKRESHRLNWLRKLLKNSQRPRIMILEECNVENWAFREKWWISKYKLISKLVNNTDGGEGAYGYKHTKERLLKIVKAQFESWKDEGNHIKRSISMRGFKKTGNLKKSKNTRKNISLALKGKKNALNYKWSDEQRQHLSEALKKSGKMVRTTSFKKGVVFSEEMKAKMSAGHRKGKNGN